MNKLTLVILLVAFLAVATLAQKPRKFKKGRTPSKKFFSLRQKLNRLKQEEKELEEEITENIEDEAPEFDPSADDDLIDPCEDLYCGPGRECLIDEEGKGSCQCVEFCSEVEDNRRKVCSNDNNTWSSDCELYRMRCNCVDKNEKCINPEFEHLHIDYYGDCQAVTECNEDDKADFPRRMREWLFNIMRDMADREELSEHYKELEKVAEENENKKWTNAAIWKWCELDGHPKDKSVSRHELFPLRAPLYTLEHCIAPFLDSCDPNGDHRVTLKEWAECLELSEDDIDDMEDLCEDIKESSDEE